MNPVIIIAIAFVLLVPLSAHAVVSETVYKDDAYSIKSNYYDLSNELKNGISSAEKVLSLSNFENSDAKKKIDIAWNVRWMALESHGKIDNNLKKTETFLTNKHFKTGYNKLLKNDQDAYSLKEDLYSIVNDVKNAQTLEKQYQENNIKCFLIWCDDVKDTYSSMNTEIHNLESKLETIENKLSQIKSKQSVIADKIKKYEIDDKNREIQKLDFTKKLNQAKQKQPETFEELIAKFKPEKSDPMQDIFDELDRLKKERDYLNEKSYSLEDALEEQLKKIKVSKESSSDGVSLHFSDSKGNQYNWIVPDNQYDHTFPKFSITLDDGSVQYIGDFRTYVKKSFVNVIDQVYDNSIDDEDFIYEIWYIVSKLTVYSSDIGEYPMHALETLSRGGGDCEDLVILMADMLRSSSHTKSWKIQMVVFDADNIGKAKSVNHVALKVDTGKEDFIIEATAQDEYSMQMWGGKTIAGWWIDV